MIRQNKVTLIFGRKGGGKSTLARKLALPFARRIYLDPMFEARDGVVVKSYHDLAEYLDRRLRPFNGSAQIQGQVPFSVVLRTTDPQEELKTIALLLHGDPDNPVLPGTLLVIEEMDRLCSPTDLPAPMMRLANFGRHFSVSYIGVARSPKRIHPDFRRAADEIHVGKLNEPADVDYLNDYTGSSFCDRARALKDYQFIRWPEPEGCLSPGQCTPANHCEYCRDHGMAPQGPPPPAPLT